jgi:hypothetical protein
MNGSGNTAWGASGYELGTKVTGKSYNDILKRWISRDVRLFLVLDDDAESKIFYLVVETGLGDAKAILATDFESLPQEKFEEVLKKALVWSKVAKKNKADVTKTLGCFSYRVTYGQATKICTELGTAEKPGEIGLKFFSAEGGKQTDVILSIVDRDNQFLQTTLYLEPNAILQLLKNLWNADEQYSKAVKARKKDALFQ